jgi:hypothetical protein
MAENPFDILGSMEEDMPPMEQPAMAPTEMEQKANFDRFDAPIPGQSLTDEPGNAPYEQPPEYTNLDKFMEYMFTTLNGKAVRRDVLRLLNAGVPVQVLLEPIIMQAINEGKINTDLGMLVVQPLAAMIYGMGLVAGINVVTDHGKKDLGLDPRPFEKAFKKKRVDTTPPKLPETKSNLVARRKM